MDNQQLRYVRIVIFEAVNDKIVRSLEPMPKPRAEKFKEELQHLFKDNTYYYELQEVKLV
jgi:hypothetical protein